MSDSIIEYLIPAYNIHNIIFFVFIITVFRFGSLSTIEFRQEDVEMSDLQVCVFSSYTTIIMCIRCELYWLSESFVSRKSALLEGLEVDQYIWGILNQSHTEDMEVTIDQQCNWKSITLKQEHPFGDEQDGPPSKCCNVGNLCVIFVLKNLLFGSGDSLELPYLSTCVRISKYRMIITSNEISSFFNIIKLYSMLSVFH